MRIRITKDFTSPGLEWAKGDTPDVSPKMARDLMAAGVARFLEEEAPAPSADVSTPPPPPSSPDEPTPIADLGPGPSQGNELDLDALGTEQEEE